MHALGRTNYRPTIQCTLAICVKIGVCGLANKIAASEDLTKNGRPLNESKIWTKNVLDVGKVLLDPIFMILKCELFTRALDRVFETSRRFDFSTRNLGHVMFPFVGTAQGSWYPCSRFIYGAYFFMEAIRS